MNKVIILAAGKGTRMKSELPKVLIPLKGKPMIEHLVASVIESQVTDRPVVIVSPGSQDLIKAALSNYDLEYVIQEEPLGTGHAVACARGVVADKADNVIVFNGDSPFLNSDSIKRLAENHRSVFTMMTTKLPDFLQWRQNYYHWGRIVRNEEGDVERIVEFRDATDEEKAITEVNPTLFCFNSDWLWENIPLLHDNNANNEYYITDLVNVAFSENHRIGTLLIEPREAMGINSQEELKVAESL